MAKVFRKNELEPKSLARFEAHLFEDPDAVAQMTPEEIRAAVFEEAREEAARKVEEAYAEGYRRGEEAGRTGYLERVAEAATALNASAEELERARTEYLASLEPQLVRLAVAVAERILLREVNTDPELVRRVTREAIENLVNRQSVTVRVNPADLDGMKVERIRLIEEFESIRQITVQSDESVEPGGCVVETEQVVVDARKDAEITAILDTLLKTYNGTGEAPVNEPSEEPEA